MNEVDAVKSIDDINRIKDLLLKHGNQDYSDVWALGINLALRISDILSLTYAEIDRQLSDITIQERKTGKNKDLRFNTEAIAIINRRRTTYPLDRFIFQSHGARGRSAGLPMNRSAVARKFKEIGSIVGVNLSTHSMRKTRGYMLYINEYSIEQIAKVLNHSNTSTTLSYIGISKRDTLNTFDDLIL